MQGVSSLQKSWKEESTEPSLKDCITVGLLQGMPYCYRFGCLVLFCIRKDCTAACCMGSVAPACCCAESLPPARFLFASRNRVSASFCRLNVINSTFSYR